MTEKFVASLIPLSALFLPIQQVTRAPCDLSQNQCVDSIGLHCSVSVMRPRAVNQCGDERTDDTANPNSTTTRQRLVHH